MSGEQQDKIKAFLDARYVSAPEACWRLFSFKMHKEFSAHQHDDVNDVLSITEAQETTLTAWFEINETDENTRAILYPNFPEQYVWHSNKIPKRWALRQRGFWDTSYAHFKTVNGVQYATFQDAARVLLGLLESDNQWDQCLEEALQIQLSFRLAIDIEEMAYNNSMLDIEDILLSQYGSSLRSFSGFSLPNIDTRNNPEDTSRHVYDAITESVYDTGYESSNHARIFFADGFGGTGKTYLFSALLNAARSTQSGYALSVASSETAALLLDGGRTTAHSMFKISLFDTSTTMCNIKPNSDLADLIIRQTKLIIWAESLIISWSIFEAFDRTFKDIFGKTNAGLKTVPFGGRLMVFGGDFRQVLPVIPRGIQLQQAQSYDMSLSAEIQQFADMLLEIDDGRTKTLKTHDDSTNNATNTDYIRITNSMLISGENISCLLSAVYPELFSVSNTSLPADNMSFISHTILTPKNNDVTEINRTLLEKFPDDEEPTYLSADVVCDDNQSIMCPPEYLNSIELGSLSPHALALKVECPIMFSDIWTQQAAYAMERGS
ncbi:hypothetical protein INT46_010705 [Mucor plumbeus]|uniref:ATP-dependent DNA helicase n=1 Tax=Mucor plumbeus TaxID=97098 RepID=A0A8H7QF40_9FUNG|nr:hypothetical protein INT46_010705 [Mucor plumbeus]